jgi:hypothetical protein
MNSSKVAKSYEQLKKERDHWRLCAEMFYTADWMPTEFERQDIHEMAVKKFNHLKEKQFEDDL